MLRALESERWRRLGTWSRAFGLVLLLVAFFAPLTGALLVGTAATGVLLFLFGSLTWLFRTGEPWLRRGK